MYGVVTCRSYCSSKHPGGPDVNLLFGNRFSLPRDCDVKKSKVHLYFSLPSTNKSIRLQTSTFCCVPNLIIVPSSSRAATPSSLDRLALLAPPPPRPCPAPRSGWAGSTFPFGQWRGRSLTCILLPDANMLCRWVTLCS